MRETVAPVSTSTYTGTLFIITDTVNGLLLRELVMQSIGKTDSLSSPEGRSDVSVAVWIGRDFEVRSFRQHTVAICPFL